MREQWTTYPDCGVEYVVGAPHYAFCSHHTCEDCGAGYPFVIHPDIEGRRVCNDCKFANYRESQGRARELERDLHMTKAALEHEQQKPSRESEYWREARDARKRLEKLEKQNVRLKRRLAKKKVTIQTTGRVFVFD